MSTRTAASGKPQKESRGYQPSLSKEEKAERNRKAVAAHYRKNPEMREKKKMQMREARQSAAKKLAKRKWDSPKKQKEVSMSIPSGDPEPGSEDWDMEEYLKFARPIMGARPPSPTCSELGDEPGTMEPRDEDEAVASQVLSSMFLARQQQIQMQDSPVNCTTPSRNSRRRHETPPLPPSSAPSASPAGPQRPSQANKKVPRKSWVSPGEWDDPGSPLPSSAYERMPWPRLFNSLFGPKGDAEPDGAELEALGLKG
ncbi:hypothetical protein DFH09DRAFT_1106603 [Mycena vulgaris]|nr:hypothetical protein DFH09DRAFT_1106603 [Mycena vulgaris]